MLLKVSIAGLLVAATVFLHSVGLAALLRRLLASRRELPTRFWPITLLLIRVSWWLILIHLAEVTAWAVFYRLQGCFPDVESAFYFSGVSYTTVGYGDLLLPPDWRLLGPVEGLTGILMCGLSTGVFFAVLSRVMTAKFGIKGRGPLQELQSRSRHEGE